jgi:hypothetical protein
MPEIKTKLMQDAEKAEAYLKRLEKKWNLQEKKMLK